MMERRYFSKAKLYEQIFYQLLTWFSRVNRMSLRPGLLWLTIKLALIIQCVSHNNIFFLSVLHTPRDVFAYPRLKTTDLETVGSSTSHKPMASTARYWHIFKHACACVRALMSVVVSPSNSVNNSHFYYACCV
jgi:hypothetical protein